MPPSKSTKRRYHMTQALKIASRRRAHIDADYAIELIRRHREEAVPFVDLEPWIMAAKTGDYVAYEKVLISTAVYAVGLSTKKWKNVSVPGIDHGDILAAALSAVSIAIKDWDGALGSWSAHYFRVARREMDRAICRNWPRFARRYNQASTKPPKSYSLDAMLARDTDHMDACYVPAEPEPDHTEVSTAKLDGSDRLKKLNGIQRGVMAMRYGIGHPRAYSLAEVAAHYERSREEIRRVEVLAFKNLGAM